MSPVPFKAQPCKNAGMESGKNEGLAGLLADVRACTICRSLPLGPKPLLQIGGSAKILIAGQAPGRKTHESGVPFDDQSGKRLREWLGVDRERFYDPDQIALLPMGFCFPGSGKSGDLPPRAECAPAWRARLLAELPEIELTIVIGRYAQQWHLGEQAGKTLTATVAAWRDFWPALVPMPHPSPRNAIWIRKNPAFEAELLPRLRQRVRQILAGRSEIPV